MNNVVLNIDFSFLLSPLNVQLLNYFLLLFEGNISVKDLAIKSLDLRLHISQFVLSDLQISLGPQTHLSDLCQGCQVSSNIDS